MDHPLYGPNLKMSVARKAIDDLGETVESFIGDPNVHRFGMHRDPDTRETVYTAVVTKPLNPEWSVEIGTIAHLMRSSLDNLVWSISDPTLRIDDESAYPIYDQPIEHPHGFGIVKHKKGRRKGTLSGPLAGVSDPHRTMLERTQPYFAGNRGCEDPIWRLRCLNVADRHRVIPITRLACVYWKTRPTFEGYCLKQVEITPHFGVPFENGAEFARIDRSKMDVPPKFRIYISFGEGCSETCGLAVFDALESMYSRVRGIIDTFAPKFGATPSHDPPPDPSTEKG